MKVNNAIRNQGTVFSHFFKVLIIALIILPSSSISREARWHNTNISFTSDEDAQARFNYDSGRCQAESNTVYPPRDNAPHTLFSQKNEWDYSSRSSNGVTTKGTIRQREGSLIDFSKPAQLGGAAQAIENHEYEKSRVEFLNSCMRVNGWRQE